MRVTHYNGFINTMYREKKKENVITCIRIGIRLLKKCQIEKIKEFFKKRTKYKH